MGDWDPFVNDVIDTIKKGAYFAIAIALLLGLAIGLLIGLTIF